MALQHYGGRIPLVRMDAHDLPFPTCSFDVAILYEAIYYLEQPGRFLAECHRILRDRGVLVICSVNREWRDFNPSPFSTRYYSARELQELLKAHGFGVELFGAFPILRQTARDHLVSFVKRTAVRLNAIPKTMKGKEFLKRVFLGELVPLPSEITEDTGRAWPLIPLADSSPASNFKVIYAVGRK